MSTNKHKSTTILSKASILLALTVTAVTAGVFLRSSGDQSPGSIEEENTGEGTVQQISFDGPVYDSVESLRNASDVIVMGVIGETVSTQLDQGGDDANPGVPLAFVTVTVDDLFKGQADGSLVVSTLDPKIARSDDISAFNKGDTVLLFLKHEDKETAPGITDFDSHYSIIGLNNGVLDVLGESVVPRSIELQSLISGSPKEPQVNDQGQEVSGKLTKFDLKELVAFLRGD